MLGNFQLLSIDFLAVNFFSQKVVSFFLFPSYGGNFSELARQPAAARFYQRLKW